MQREADSTMVRHYHHRTKHHLNRYARGPGGLDWATQPDPFRRYRGCECIPLPLTADYIPTLYRDLYRPQALRPRPLALEWVAALFELGFGISAWKQYGEERWALRCNPSSGNLHPTEAYCISPGLPQLPAGVYHYASYVHCLEQRCRFPDNISASLLPAEGVLVGLSSIHWREAWKYGERAYRYCQHDAGHALGTVAYAAATLGWSARLVPFWGDSQIAALLGLDRERDYAGAEPEYPEVILFIGPSLPHPETLSPEPWLAGAEAGVWRGQANTLSSRHRLEWPIIAEVAQACAKPATQETAWQAPLLPEPLATDCRLPAATLIRRRRSAQALDGQAPPLASQTFFRMLDMTLPRPRLTPWTAWPWAPRLHLLLFVHCVEDLSPGLYALLRHPETDLRLAMRQEFLWQRPESCPAHLPLYHLVPGDVRRAAGFISCQQPIAATGAFSLGMISEFEAGLAVGPWGYRRLFWEAGLLGQILYLEAEAAGLRGTGIGCYFDDMMHQALGVTDSRFQSLYHFTLGVPLEDIRLQTLPPYGHLSALRGADSAIDQSLR